MKMDEEKRVKENVISQMQNMATYLESLNKLLHQKLEHIEKKNSSNVNGSSNQSVPKSTDGDTNEGASN